MALPRLLLFTDEAVCAARGRGVIASVAKAFAGVDVDGRVAVVVRHKRDAAQAAALTAALRPVCRAARALLFAHTDARLVGPLGLDGVHLPGTVRARTAALQVPPGRVIGRSAHVDDVDVAGAGYQTLSPIFGAGSKVGDTRAPLGVGALRGRRTPTYALGGVDVYNARACLEHGAVGVAVVSAVFGAVDPRRALLDLLEVLA